MLAADLVGLTKIMIIRHLKISTTSLSKKAANERGKYFQKYKHVGKLNDLVIYQLVRRKLEGENSYREVTTLTECKQVFI